ncbi:MAG: T9SS type B sorting domain-containing protein [Pedobacter sp.]|nr:MAG: T9SS type B sorting domain-containing protein [Pedobacter sp.]
MFMGLFKAAPKLIAPLILTLYIMKRILFLLLMLSSFFLNAQVINKAEYFIDTDPGVGSGINIPVGTNGTTVNFTASVPTAGLTDGFHNLYIRTRLDNGIWSHYENRAFYLSKFAAEASNVKAAEYFIDSDPGKGNGTSIPVAIVGASTSFVATIPTTGLTNGFHNLIIRTRNELGQWGLGENRVFYISTSAIAADITATEYFVDTDPGVGSGTALSVGASGATTTFTAAIATTGLSNGFHNLNIRTKNSQGIWGHFENRVFYVSNQGLPAADITAMEFFIDTDPGVGQGTAIAVTTGSIVTLIANIPTTGLTAGQHFLFLRAKSADGWGGFEKQPFTIGAAVAPTKPIIASVDAKTTSPALTNNNKPVIKGTSEPNVTIEVFNGTISLGTVTADATGNWIFTPATAINDGTLNITTKAKNASNLESVASDVFVVVIDTQAPSATTIVSIDAKTTQNFITANNKPIIVGKAEALSTVEIFNGATKLGEVNADAGGNYSFTPLVALGDGSYIITSSAKDAAGNVGGKSAGFSFNVLTLIPSAPVIVSVDAKTTQNFVTNSNKPIISGTASSAIVVEVFSGNTSLGTTSATAGSIFNFTPITALADGTYTITAKTKNAANVYSLPSNSFIFSIDTQAPTIPVIVSIVNQTNQNFATNVNRPLITGTGEPGSIIEIFNAGVSLGFATVDAGGKFTFTPTTSLADGIVAITTKAKDAAGNTSSSSTSFTFTVDTQAPNAPIITSVDGKITQNFITTNNKPILTGTAEPGSIIEVFNGTTSLGFVTVAANGTYTFTSSTSFPDGNYILNLKTKDAAGNISSSSANFNFTIDATAPNAPVITSVDAKTTQNFATSNNRPVTLGTAENLASVELFNGTTSFAVITANAIGNFTFTPAANQPDGSYALTAKAKDAAGNVSVASASFSFRIDTSVPLAPTITSVDAKSSQGFTTGNNRPIILGTAEAAASVELFNGTTSLGIVNATATGSYTFTPISALPDGNYVLTAKAKDAANNLSIASSTFSFTIDTKAPNIPIIASVDGKSISPAVSTVLKPILLGTAEAGSTVAIFNANTLAGTVVANTSGNWIFTIPIDLPIGIHSFAVTAKDVTGNESAKSNVFVYDLIPVNKEVTANNVLTPNGDGKNDFLVLNNLQYYAKSLIRIYDRAGRTVFTANAYKNDWSGDLNGTTLAEGTYYYVVDLGDGFKAFKSFVTIVRKSIR